MRPQLAEQVASPAANLARLSLLAVALSLAGCASDEEYRRQVYAQQVGAHQAGAMRGAMAQPKAAEPELEDDGLPSQVAPLLDRARTPDDPSEPFSPNYGKPAAARKAETTVPTSIQGTTVANAPHRVATR